MSIRLGVLFGACAVFAGCATTSSAQGADFQSRLPNLVTVVTAARAQSWGAELKQIPATVIEVGELASVPYLSYAGKDIELNVYGDPAKPAGIEIGTKSDSPEVRKAIRDFLGGLLAVGDQKALDALAEGAKSEADGLTLEQTLPTAADGFGAWWVTAWHPDGMRAAKATVGELSALTNEPTMELTDALAFPEVGAHPNFHNYPRYRPVGKKVYATAYYKEAGAYHRRGK